MKNLSHNIAILLLALLLPMLMHGQSIQRMEYFFDTDPGVGNGSPIAISAVDTVDQQFTLLTTFLSPGFHRLIVRVQNTLGQWSISESRSIYVSTFSVPAQPDSIIAAEYFYDTDPGVGNGLPILINTTDTVFDNFAFSTVGLVQGHHTVFIRFLNGDGVWSIYEGRPFYIADSATSTLAQTYRVEYFVDSDPGVGNGIQFLYNPADTLDVNFTIPTTGLTSGPHYIYTRVFDTQNLSSFTRVDTFSICNSAVSGLLLNNATTCLGDTINFVLTGNNLSSASQFLWDIDSDGTYEGITTVPQWQWTPTNHTQTSITAVAVELSGCESSALAAISVAPAFSGVTFDLIPPSNPTICPGDSALVQWLLSYTGNLFEVKYYLNGTYVPNFQYLLANGEGDTVQVQAAFIFNEPCRDVDTIWSSINTYYRISLPDPGVIVHTQLAQYCMNQSVDLVITPIDPGTGVQYLLYKNNQLVATITPNDNLPYVYSLSGMAPGDSIHAAMIHVTPCIGLDTVFGNYSYPNIISAVAPSVDIQALVSSFCQGDTVLAWISSTLYPGSNPAFQWYRNGVALLGENNDTLIYLNTGIQDTIWVSMTSTDPCAATPSVISNTIIQTGQILQIPSVIISQVTSNPCLGDSVIYQVDTYSFGGFTPSFEWLIDGVLSNFTGQSITLTPSPTVLVQARMTSTLACVSSSTVLSNQIQTTVSPVIVPSLQVAQLDTVCSGAAGSYYAFNVTNAPSNSVIEWYVDGVLQNGVVGDTVLISVGGSSTVQAMLISNSPCVASSVSSAAISPVFTVDPVATATLSYGPSGDSTCYYGQVGMTFTHSNLPTYGPIIIWYGNGSIVDTTLFPLPLYSIEHINNFADSMSIYGVVEWQNSCGVTNTIVLDTLLIYRRDKVNTTFTIGGQSSTVVNHFTYCQNEGILPFNMSHVFDIAYSPSVVEMAIDYTIGTINISQIPPGIYMVYYQLTDPLTFCYMVDSLKFTILQTPQQPVVVQVGAQLQISNLGAPSDYQWLDANQLPISGATLSSFSPPNDGIYYVQSSYTNGCSEVSQAFNFMWFNVLESNNLEVNVFPVPFFESLKVEMNYSGQVTYQVLDAVGKHLIQGTVEVQDRFEIRDLNYLSPGTYFLEIRTENYRRVFRLVKG